MDLNKYIKQDSFFVTLVSNKTGVAFCYKIAKKNSVYFVSVMTGTTFEKYFTFLGYYRKDDFKTLLAQKSNPENLNLSSFKAFEYLLKNIDSAPQNKNLKILKKFVKC